MMGVDALIVMEGLVLVVVEVEEEADTAVDVEVCSSINYC